MQKAAEQKVNAETPVWVKPLRLGQPGLRD